MELRDGSGAEYFRGVGRSSRAQGRTVFKENNLSPGSPSSQAG